MRRLTASLVFFLTAGVSFAAWSFDPVHLTFEEGYQLNKVIVRGTEKPRLRAPGRLPGTTGNDFDFTVDPGSQYEVWLNPREAKTGRRSLAFRIHSDRNENIKDKIEMDFVKHDQKEQRLTMEPNNVRYLSFDFMLDRQYETPNAWALHVQVWQPRAGPPPFAIFVVPGNNRNSDVQFSFVIRDDQVGGGSSSPSSGKEIYRMTIPRGEWNNMVIRMEPSANDDDRVGRLAMWHNSNEKFDYRGDWGYRAAGKIKGGRQAADFLVVKIGVYRRRQATAQTIYFDNVRYGTTFSSVTE
jgi:hypothetical protein